MTANIDHGLIVDNFCGGGGASLGISRALGVPIDIAVNHDAASIAMHEANHPETLHLRDDVWHVRPAEVCAGRPVRLAWFSPDCTHHSKAKGGKPRKKKIRALAWIVVRWMKALPDDQKPQIVMLENVEEFADWGPLDERNQPIKDRKGETFRRWVRAMKRLGYVVEWRMLVAADYGVPTTRKRLYLIARRDGQAIVWPEPTHAKQPEKYLHTMHLVKWRGAWECIDWTIPCPSIFERKKPLAENTLKRIAEGIRRYVIEYANPFIVEYHAPKFEGDHRTKPLSEPLPTQTTENRFALVEPTLVGIDNKTNGAGSTWPVGDPLRTVTAKGDSAVVSAFLAKHYTGVIGQDLREPLGTVTAVDHHSQVYAFLTKYYGTGNGSCMQDPVGTVTSKDRMGLVVIHGAPYQIADIGLRMLQPRELARAQGFPDTYVLTGTKTNQVARIGNSVCPDMATALVRANLPQARAGRAAA